MYAILNRSIGVRQAGTGVLLLVALAASARADIFQWEYIDPAVPSQGKRQSATLAPDGAAVDAVPGADLSGRDLTMAYLIGANLTNARFFSGITYCCGYAFPQNVARLGGADLTAADLRGSRMGARYGDVFAIVFSIQAFNSTANMIGHDGLIDGVDLNAGGLLVVRDYDGDPNGFPPTAPIPIAVGRHLTIGPGATLQMVFEADAWDSTISFAPGIPVTLGGTLELTFADDVNLASQIGRTFDLFNWTGVTPTGAFAFSSPYLWDVSKLYTAGEITLLSVPEPATFLLSALGLLGMIFRVRRPLPRIDSKSIEEPHAETQSRGGVSIGRSTLRPQRLCVSLLLLVAFAWPARADIFQWEYINPADPVQGKQQSTTLAPDGAGIDAVPGADISYRNLTMAYLIGADLTGAITWAANLTNADLSHANLTNAQFFDPKLTNAELTGANVQRANFGNFLNPFGGQQGYGISLPQLYSTASYQTQDLSGIGLKSNNLAGGNFAGQNLTNADFSFARLTGADFTDSEIRGANFDTSGITQLQLYSTVSYIAKDLNAISLSFNDLSGWNFAGQNLNNVDFYGAGLIGADFTAADVRGAEFADDQLLANANTTNLIWRDGHIHGLDLNAGRRLVVRDDDVGSAYVLDAPPIPITVDQRLAIEASGTLRMVFEADAWDSTISFAPDIPVTLGGTLELTFAADVNLASQVGRTFDLFNWTGVTPTGTFAISSPYAWDLSNLYTTGELTLIAVPEPGTGFLFGLSFTSVLAVRRVAQHSRNRVPRFAGPDLHSGHRRCRAGRDCKTMEPYNRRHDKSYLYPAIQDDEKT